MTLQGAQFCFRVDYIEGRWSPASTGSSERERISRSASTYGSPMARALSNRSLASRIFSWRLATHRGSRRTRTVRVIEDTLAQREGLAWPALDHPGL